MSLTLNLPDSAERTFRQAWGDEIDRKGLEALAMEGYREGKLSLGKLAEFWVLPLLMMPIAGWPSAAWPSTIPSRISSPIAAWWSKWQQVLPRSTCRT